MCKLNDLSPRDMVVYAYVLVIKSSREKQTIGTDSDTFDAQAIGVRHMSPCHVADRRVHQQSAFQRMVPNHYRCIVLCPHQILQVQCIRLEVLPVAYIYQLPVLSKVDPDVVSAVQAFCQCHEFPIRREMQSFVGVLRVADVTDGLVDKTPDSES